MDPALIGLIGVALGAMLSLAGQLFTARSSRVEGIQRRLDARREERRLVIREFLEEAQQAEERAVFRYQNGSVPEGASSARLWYRQKYLAIVSSRALGNKAENYAGVLDRILWHNVDKGEGNVWDVMGPSRNDFLEEAAKLLGTD